MKLTRPRYQVAVLDADGVTHEHEIEVTPGDQLRAELEAGRQGLPTIAPGTAQNHTAVMIWASLHRQKLYTGHYQDFVNRDLYAWEGVKDEETGEPAATVVDPTAAQSPTGSPAPPTSEPSSTGSTPTSTSAS